MADTNQESFLRVDNYAWNNDSDYLNLKRVMAEKLGPEMAATPEIEGQTRTMLAKKKWGLDIDGAEYNLWRQQNETNKKKEVPTNSTNERYPSNYKDIVELILQGKPIPGVKEIPDTVLGHEASSQSSVTQRKKPWE